MVKWSKLSKARVFRGQEKKIDTKILHHPGLYPQFFLPAAPFFIFCSAKKGSLEARFLHRTQKILPAAPFILFFTPQKEKCKRLTIHRRKHWFRGLSNPREHFIGMHTVTTRERMPVQNHCPIQIIFPTSLGIPLHFAAKNATRPKLQKVLRACSAPGFGTPF